jgi:hypothetical protein
MWRCVSSQEHLPLGVKTELGAALVRRVRNNDFTASELWCLARLGARQLFYGPINQVLPAATVSRWVESLAKIPAAAETLARLAQQTGDSTRDLSPASVDLVRRSIGEDPRLLSILEGAAEDSESLARVFGEELPSGLTLGGD